MKNGILKFKRAVHGFISEFNKNPLVPSYAGNKYECPVCKFKLSKFAPLAQDYLEQLDKHGYIHSIFQGETFNIFNYSCPNCWASDRDRLYSLYITERVSKNNEERKLKFIDFAPSPGLSTYLRGIPKLNYRSADLFIKDVDDRVDLMDMHIYGSGSIDAFLCSHVLEHVIDDRIALKELYRILKPGGWGIIMVPIILNLKEIHEDPNITNEGERWKHFGQNDHLRIYSKSGFVGRLKEVGFKVNELGIEHFGNDKFNIHGIHPRSILYIVEK